MNIQNQNRESVFNEGARRNGVPRKNGRLVSLVVLVVILIAGALFAKSLYRAKASGIHKDTYQAVFLSNGQVYFGKLDFVSYDTVRLSDIYYAKAGATTDPNPAQLDVQLVKLGSELHQPEDAMYRNRDHLLFYENLTVESRVLKAINAHNGK